MATAPDGAVASAVFCLVVVLLVVGCYAAPAGPLPEGGWRLA